MAADAVRASATRCRQPSERPTAAIEIEFDRITGRT
ncbi:hypothetical protein BH24ACT3_BH24ACT3_17340 [soil metagenome]